MRCFDEGVLRSDAEANIGSIMGIGFPPWTGGVVQYIKGYEAEDGAVGPAAFVARAQDLAAKYGDRFAPPASLDRGVQGGQGPPRRLTPFRRRLWPISKAPPSGGATVVFLEGTSLERAPGPGQHRRRRRHRDAELAGQPQRVVGGDADRVQRRAGRRRGRRLGARGQADPQRAGVQRGDGPQGGRRRRPGEHLRPAAQDPQADRDAAQAGRRPPGRPGARRRPRHRRRRPTW